MMVHDLLVSKALPRRLAQRSPADDEDFSKKWSYLGPVLADFPGFQHHIGAARHVEPALVHLRVTRALAGAGDHEFLQKPTPGGDVECEPKAHRLGRGIM